MKYQNPRLAKLNEEIRSVGGVMHGNIHSLYSATQNYVNNMRKLWRMEIGLPQYQATAFQKYYRDLRETLMSLGADIHGLPRRLRIKTERTARAA